MRIDYALKNNGQKYILELHVTAHLKSFYIYSLDFEFIL